MERLKEIGFLIMVRNYEKYKINCLEELIKFCLIQSSKLGAHSVVTEICTYLKVQDQGMVINVLHFKDENKNTALYFANINYDLNNGLDLISLEKQAHKDDRAGALKCIRKEAGYHKLDLWMLETYKKLHPPSKCSRISVAFPAVLFTVIPSIIFFYLDFASDIALAKQYFNMAYGELNQTNCPVQQSYETCFREAIGNISCIHANEVAPILKNLLSNETCIEFDEMPQCEQTDYESMKLKYEMALGVMVFSILVSLLIYGFNSWKMKIQFSYIENQHARKIFEILIRIFWPIYYVYEEFSYRIKDEKEREEEKDEMTSQKSWKLLRAIENGIENYVQMMLQMYLILPYIGFIISLPVDQILSLSVQNIFNMFSMPESFCDKSDGYAALGKLTLTSLSYSYGMSSRQSTKKGQTLGQSIKNLVLWFTYSMYNIARIMALYSLLSLSHPLPAVLTFIILHIGSVLLIQVYLKEIKTNYATNSIRKLTAGFLVNLISAICSHTLISNIHTIERGEQSFLRQTLFQILILIENITMMLIPMIAPESYPDDECLQIHPSLIYYSFFFWLAGVVLQVQL